MSGKCRLMRRLSEPTEGLSMPEMMGGLEKRSEVHFDCTR